MVEVKAPNWSAIVALGIFIVTSCIGYGVLLQRVTEQGSDLTDLRMEVRDLSKSFITFLTSQPRKEALR